MDAIMDPRQTQFICGRKRAQAIDSFYTGWSGRKETCPLGFHWASLAASHFMKPKNILVGEVEYVCYKRSLSLSVRAEIIWGKQCNYQVIFSRSRQIRLGRYGKFVSPSEIISAFFKAQLEDIRTIIRRRRKSIWDQYFKTVSSDWEAQTASAFRKFHRMQTNNGHMFCFRTQPKFRDRSNQNERSATFIRFSLPEFAIKARALCRETPWWGWTAAIQTVTVIAWCVSFYYDFHDVEM